MATVASLLLCMLGTMLIGMFVNLLVCGLSLVELGRKKEEVWNGETWSVDWMPFEEYFKQFDIWYELPRWLEEIVEKECGEVDKRDVRG